MGLLTDIEFIKAMANRGNDLDMAKKFVNFYVKYEQNKPLWFCWLMPLDGPSVVVDFRKYLVKSHPNARLVVGPMAEYVLILPTPLTDPEVVDILLRQNVRLTKE